MRCALAILLASFVAVPASGQSFTLVTSPATAKISGLDAAGNKVQLGIGSAKIKLDKNAANRFWISADGFASLDTVFSRTVKYPKSITIALTSRIVRVTALPYDAEIRVNGEPRGTQSADVVVPPGIPVTVEVSKGGFRSEKRIYRNESGVELPATERFELRDRQVNVQPSLPRNTDVAAAQPTVSVDGNVVGTGNVDVVVPFDKCVTVQVSLPGYKPEPRTLCNKADSQVPPARLPVGLVDRLVALSTSPASAQIYLDDKPVGTGSYNLIVRNNDCVKVIVFATGFSAEAREFCNRDNTNLASESRIELRTDESYLASVESDQANVNFTIEVGPERTLDQAWQTISQVVVSLFDVLEITDKETGYMRTAWEVSKFNSGQVVRTRVIVKNGGISPLKYIIKVASECTDYPGASIKDDERFKEWPRMMKQYKDIINELQARLR